MLQQAYDGAVRFFKRLTTPRESPQEVHTAEVLRSSALFADLSTLQLRYLAKAVHFRQFKPAEYVYHEGDPGLGLYLIQTGVVRLTVLDEEGQVQEVARLESGDIFGELSLYGEFNRLETAQAAADTRLVGFFRPDLRTIMMRNPRLAAAVSMKLAQHLADRQMALIQELAEREGKFMARRLLHSLHSGAENGTTEFLVD